MSLSGALDTLVERRTFWGLCDTILSPDFSISGHGGELRVPDGRHRGMLGVIGGILVSFSKLLVGGLCKAFGIVSHDCDGSDASVSGASSVAGGFGSDDGSSDSRFDSLGVACEFLAFIDCSDVRRSKWSMCTFRCWPPSTSTM